MCKFLFSFFYAYCYCIIMLLYLYIFNYSFCIKIIIFHNLLYDFFDILGMVQVFREWKCRSVKIIQIITVFIRHVQVFSYYSILRIIIYTYLSFLITCNLETCRYFSSIRNNYYRITPNFSIFMGHIFNSNIFILKSVTYLFCENILVLKNFWNRSRYNVYLFAIHVFELKTKTSITIIAFFTGVTLSFNQHETIFLQRKNKLTGCCGFILIVSSRISKYFYSISFSYYIRCMNIFSKYLCNNLWYQIFYG